MTTTRSTTSTVPAASATLHAAPAPNAAAAATGAARSGAPASFEDAVGELDRLVAAMEGGQLPLDRLLDNYRRGAELLSFCRGRLEAVEQQVKVLEDGELKPWIAP